MENTAPTARRTRLAALVVAGLAVVSLSAGAMSLALFTDQETDDSTFSSGSIVLDADKIDSFNLTNTNLMPGDSVTGVVEVSNTGDNNLRYSLSSASTDASSPNGAALYTALTVEVRVADVDNTCTLFTGAVLQVSETLGESNVLFGTPSSTVSTGDRPVASGASDWICVRVALPAATDNTFQSASSVTTFTFDAEQTENN